MMNDESLTKGHIQTSFPASVINVDEMKLKELFNDNQRVSGYMLIFAFPVLSILILVYLFPLFTFISWLSLQAQYSLSNDERHKWT